MSTVTRPSRHTPPAAAAPPPTAGPAKTLVAICTLRESENVTTMLTSLRQNCPAADLLVIDDNSDDGTADLARRFAADDHNRTRVVVRQTRGLGSAITATMGAAIEGGYEYLVNLDADFSHDPATVPSLIDRAERTGAGVVVGSRYTAGGKIVGWPLHRRWMSRRINRLAISRLNLPVSDCSGSMRCYRVESLQALNPATLTSPGYSILEEVLHRLHQMNVPMDEVPITFTDRQAGTSKLTLPEAARSLWKILRL